MLSDAYDMMTRTKAQIAGYGSNKPGAYKSKALRFVHSYGVPFGRLWYVKAALNHMVYQQMMEDLSPGYSAAPHGAAASRLVVVTGDDRAAAGSGPGQSGERGVTERAKITDFWPQDRRALPIP
jgi:hypothetical protein